MIRHEHPKLALRWPRRWWSRDLTKTFTYLAVHLTVGFSVAYALTGSVAIAGGIALIEPMVNAVAFYFHERFWKRYEEKETAQESGALPSETHRSVGDGFDPWVLHPTVGHPMHRHPAPRQAPPAKPRVRP